MPLDLSDDKSTLVQVMAWCRQATSHYPSQCWPRCMSPNGVTRPQWVKGDFCTKSGTTWSSQAQIKWSSISQPAAPLINWHRLALIPAWICHAHITCPAAFAKLYSSTSANNSILAGVQYIFIQKKCPNIGHWLTNINKSCADVVSQTLQWSLGSVLQLTKNPGSPSSPPTWYAGWSTQTLDEWFLTL